MRPGRAEVVDSDVDLSDPVQLAETRPRQWDVVVAIAIGGVLGAEARYGLGEIVPHAARQFPWSTLIVNATGCLLIGALMVLLLELTSPHRLARPFLGVGLLGGYTTFSTFAVDADRLVEEHRPLIALAYVGATVVLCLFAVLAATVAAHFAGTLVVNTRIRHRDEGRPR
jgi:CrcB protein